MNFLSNLADSTHIVGHTKGLYHYVRGDEKKGHEAMYQSTRSSAVLTGAVFGGPAGAMAAALATDAVASGIMNEEKGLIDSCKNIGDDIEAKRDPTRSIGTAALQLGLDGLSGYGGSSGGVRETGRAAGKTMQRSVKQSILKSSRISSEEAAKMVARKYTAGAAANTVQRALMFTHIGLTAAQRTDYEEQCKQEKERERSEREWRERQREEREWRELEQRERERRESQQREREWRDRQQREREWNERQQRERDWIEWKERQQREREQERKREQQHSKKQVQQKSKKQEQYKEREQRANSEKRNRDTSGSSSGSSQPPQDNKDNNKKREEKNELSFFDTFMILLKRILKIVYGNKSEPFSIIFEKLYNHNHNDKIAKEQRKYLVKVVKPIVGSGTLEVVIELVMRMFKQHYYRDTSFLTFLSLLEFVQTYVTEELLKRTRISSGTETAEMHMKPKERRGKIISEIASEKDIVKKLIDLFEKLKTDIEAETAACNIKFPDFRDIFAAVSHYFKHRRVPDNGRIISVKEYYDWIQKFLGELEQTQKLTALKDSKIYNYVHEVFVPIFRRRFRIVLKFRDDNIVLGSAFVVTMMHPDDKEKLAVVMVAELFVVVFMAITVLYNLKNIFTLLLKTPLIVFNSITFTVQLLFYTIIFAFVCFIFILKVLLNILLLFAFVWFLFFYLPNRR